jgi:hypothetical protein
MPAIGRRRSQRAGGDEDPQPRISALAVAFLTHPFVHLSRHSRGLVAVFGDPLVRGAVNVEIGDGHGGTVVRLSYKVDRLQRLS